LAIRFSSGEYLASPLELPPQPFVRPFSVDSPTLHEFPPAFLDTSSKPLPPIPLQQRSTRYGRRLGGSKQSCFMNCADITEQKLKRTLCLGLRFLLLRFLLRPPVTHSHPERTTPCSQFQEPEPHRPITHIFFGSSIKACEVSKRFGSHFIVRIN
jgi:hypothetical protein